MHDWLETDTPEPAAAPTAVAAPDRTPYGGRDARARAIARIESEAAKQIRQQVVSKYGSTGPSRKEIDTALRMVTRTQRIYLEELLANGFLTETARTATALRVGKPLSRARVAAWDRNERYNAARRVLGLSIATALNPHENLLRLEKSIELAMKPRMRYAGGTPTGEMEIDVGAMQKGIELAAKINKQLGSDVTVSNRVTVQILDLTDAEAPDFGEDGKVIEGSVEPAPAEQP